jgi:hypothetical protein
MLGNIFPKPNDEKIKKEMEKAREKVIRQATTLRKLVSNDRSGWNEYVSLLQDYVTACKRRKAVTALDTADDKTLAQLKLIDHEVWLINTFILHIPRMVFDQEKNIENMNKQEAEHGIDD